ncbi:MAG: pyridoxal 5'-phosphate synthase, partial [Terriglobia bacterium]
MSASSDDGGIAEGQDPIAQFHEWFAQAKERELNDPEAMALATVDEAGLPDVRMILLKGVDERGFVFYTNLESAKGRELSVHPKAALVFHWKSLRRQIRVRGMVAAVAEHEADAYFASRAKDSQIGAWASHQSHP